MSRCPLGLGPPEPTSYPGLGPNLTHRLDGEGSDPQVTCKLSVPTSQMEMEKGPTYTHDMQAIGPHMSTRDGENSYRYTWHVSHQVPQVR